MRGAARRHVAPLLHEMHLCATSFRALLPIRDTASSTCPSMMWSDELDSAAESFARASAGGIDPVVLGQPLCHQRPRLPREPADTVSLRAEHATRELTGHCELGRRMFRSAAVTGSVQLSGYATPRCAVRIDSAKGGPAVVYGFAFCRDGALAAAAAAVRTTPVSSAVRVFAVTACAADNTMTFKQLPPGAREANLIAALMKAGEGMVAAAATYSAQPAPAARQFAGALGTLTPLLDRAPADADTAALEEAATAALASAAAAAAAGTDPRGLGSREDFAEHTLPLRGFPSHIADGCIRAAADVALALLEQQASHVGSADASCAGAPASPAAARGSPMAISPAALASPAGPAGSDGYTLPASINWERLHAPLASLSVMPRGYTLPKAASAGHALATASTSWLGRERTLPAAGLTGADAVGADAVARQLHFGPDYTSVAASAATAPRPDLRDLKDLIAASRAQLEALQARGPAPSSYVSPTGVRYSQQALYQAVTTASGRSFGSAASGASTVTGASRCSEPELFATADVRPATMAVAGDGAFTPLLPTSPDSTWPGNWSVASSCAGGLDRSQYGAAAGGGSMMEEHLYASPGSHSRSATEPATASATAAASPSAASRGFPFPSMSSLQLPHRDHSTDPASWHAQRQALVARVMGQSSLVLDGLDTTLARHSKPAPAPMPMPFAAPAAAWETES